MSIIVPAQYVSVWCEGEIITDCMLDIINNEVFNIEQCEDCEDLSELFEEYVMYTDPETHKIITVENYTIID